MNKQPDTQYNVFGLQVKYIMLCMDLWREREYPVDKLRPAATRGISAGFQDIDFSDYEKLQIKNYYQVKNVIKKMYRNSRSGGSR